MLLFLVALLPFCKGALPAPPLLQPNPLAGVVSALRAFAAASPAIAPSGLDRQSLLQTIAPVVQWFLPHQNASTGAIIDPATHLEMEYATPCFAHAAATLVVHGGRSDLLGAAAAALTCSIRELTHPPCATASCDFFALPVMRTLDLLLPLVPAATGEAWVGGLKNITLKTWEKTGNNWELTAAAGEYIRIVKKGWGGAALNWTYWEGRIGFLATAGAGGFFSPEGMFLDNIGASGRVTSPMAYDAFGSTYPAVLLNDGYNETGFYRDFLGETTQRGVWTRAAYQSPLGEQPVGGRSNQHQFAEATLCAVAHLYARKAMDAGDAQGACQLKRAAQLYHSSLRRWVRPDGALQITKNWYLNYTERFGFMSYSYFSNYNLLPASWLALAFEFFDETIPECAGIADIGGAAFAVDNVNMRKVYASVGGTYLELMTGADAMFDASGLNRLHYDACALPSKPTPCRLPSLLGPSQGPGISGNFGGAWGEGGGLSTGLVWALAADAPGAPRRSLANKTLLDITCAYTRVSPTNSPGSGVGFTTSYVLWGEGVLVTEDYAVAPSGGLVNVTASLAFPGPSALFALLTSAAAAAAAASGAAASAPPLAFFSPPASPALARALAAGDLGAFLAAAPAPLHAEGPPPLRSLGVSFPAMAFDGLLNYTVRLGWQKDAVLVQLPQQGSAEEGALSFSARSAGQALVWTHDQGSVFPSRNGLLSPVYAEVASPAALSISYQLAVVPWQA